MQFNRTMIMMLLLGLGTISAYVGVRAHAGRPMSPPPVVPPDAPINDPLPIEDLQMPEPKPAPWLVPSHPPTAAQTPSGPLPRIIDRPSPYQQAGGITEPGNMGYVSPAHHVTQEPPSAPSKSPIQLVSGTTLVNPPLPQIVNKVVEQPVAPPPFAPEPPNATLPRIVERSSSALVPVPPAVPPSAPPAVPPSAPPAVPPSAPPVLPPAPVVVPPPAPPMPPPQVEQPIEIKQPLLPAPPMENGPGAELRPLDRSGPVFPMPVPEPVYAGITKPMDVRPPVVNTDIRPPVAPPVPVVEPVKLPSAKADIFYPSVAEKQWPTLPSLASPAPVVAPITPPNLVEIKQGTPPPQFVKAAEMKPYVSVPEAPIAIAPAPIQLPHFEKPAEPKLSPPMQIEVNDIKIAPPPPLKAPEIQMIAPYVANPVVVNPGAYQTQKVQPENPPVGVTPGRPLFVPNPEPQRPAAFVLVNPVRRTESPSATPYVPPANVPAVPPMSMSEYPRNVPITQEVPVVKNVAPTEFAIPQRETAPTFQQLAQVAPVAQVGQLPLGNGRLNIFVKGPAHSVIGQQVVFHVQVVNGGSQPLNNIVLHANLSEGLQHSRGRQIEGDVGSLAPGAEKTIQLRTKAIRPGQHEVECIVTADNGSRATTQATITVGQPGAQAQPNVSQVGLQVHQNAQGLQVQQNPTHRVLLGQPNEVRIEVVNDSPHFMRQVSVTDTLPEELDYLQASDKGMFHRTTRTVQWLVDLGPGQMKVLTVQLQPQKSGQWTHEVQARIGAAPEVRSVGLIVAEGFANLSIRIVGRDKQVEVGKETVYQVRVINHGSAPATNVEVAIHLSDGLVVGYAQGVTKHRAQGKQITFAPLPTLNPQAEAVYHIGVMAQAPGDRRVRAQVTSDQFPTPVTREERTEVYRN